MPDAQPLRRALYFSGRVQGVGFRYESRALALGYNLSGYVRNLADGRVELVAEGEPEVLDEYERKLAARMGSCIESTERVEEGFTGEFHDFRIRF